MDVHELRIGNYVTDQWNSTPSVVTSINEKGIDLEIEDDGNWPECAHHWIEATTKADGIFGIPLTEEILTKCGFEKTYESDFTKIFTLYNWTYTIRVKKDSIMSVGLSYCNIQIPNIDVLHKLQNAYYINEGQELTVQL